MPETTDRGKWVRGNVPHARWVFLEMVDTGYVSETCQMCESAPIRYVHVMAHPDYPERLRVGCVCAENMSDDRVGPKLRERELVNEVNRYKSRLARMQALDESIKAKREDELELINSIKELGRKLAGMEKRFKAMGDAVTWLDAGQRMLEDGRLDWREREFVCDMVERFEYNPEFEPSPKQTSWFVSLCKRFGLKGEVV